MRKFEFSNCASRFKDKKIGSGLIRGSLCEFMKVLPKIKSEDEFETMLLDNMTEEDSDYLQILMRTGILELNSSYKKVFYRYAQHEKWGIVTNVHAPTCGDLDWSKDDIAKFVWRQTHSLP